MSKLNYQKMAQTQKGSVLASLLLIATVLILVLLGYFAYMQGLINAPQVKSPDLEASIKTDTPKQTEEPKPIKIEFSYKLAVIDANELSLISSRGGTLKISKDKITGIYKGATAESPKMQVEELKVGDTVNIEMIPKKSVTLFVSQM